MNTLTETQKKIAQENHYLVNYFLRYNRLEFEEYYDVVIFGYLKAVQCYNENPKCSVYKFATIANIKMHDSVYSYWAYNGRKNRKIDMLSLDACIDGNKNLTLVDTVPCIHGASEDAVLNRMEINAIMAYMSAKEKTIVKMKAAGYSASEIGIVLGCTERGINSRMYRMRKRLKENGIYRYSMREGNKKAYIA